MPAKYERLLDLFYILVILLIGVKVIYPVHGAFDLMLADESFYLDKALNLSWSGMFSDGFFYFLWLKIISIFCADLVVLYSLNYSLLVLINPVLLYVLGRKMNGDRLVSALLANFFLISTFNIFTWPFITRFAMAVIVLMFILFLSFEHVWKKMLALTGGGLILVYTRPEFTIVYLLFLLTVLGISMFKWLKSRQTPDKSQLCLISVLAVLALFTGLLKNPLAGSRDMMAFGQHYGANLQKRESLKINPWTQWRNILLEKFGTDKSLTQAIAHNPGEFLMHVRDNVKQVMPDFFYQMYPYFAGKVPGWAKKLIAVLILGLFGTAAYFFFRGNALEHKWYYVICLALILPVVAAILIIFPRSHYMLLLFGILLTGIIRSMPNLPGFPRHDAVVKVSIMLVVLFLLPWRATGAIGPLPGAVHQRCSTVERIEAVKRAAAILPVNKEVRFMGRLFKNRFNYGYFNMYVRNRGKRPFQFFHLTGKKQVRDFVNENKINMIYCNEHLKEPVPGTQTWTRIDLPVCKEFILVHLDNHQRSTHE